LIYGYPFQEKVKYPLMTEVLSVLNDFCTISGMVHICK